MRPPGKEDELARILGRDIFPVRGKVLADPLHERRLPLRGKLHELPVLFEGLGRLQAPVRLKRRVHDEHERAIVRQVADDTDERVGFFLAAFVRVIAAHLDERALAEKRHGVDRIGQRLKIELSAVKAAVAEIVLPAGNAELFVLRRYCSRR